MKHQPSTSEIEVLPRLFNFVMAIYLIIIGLVGVFNL
jgi:Protein of unknown function (DUF3096)